MAQVSKRAFEALRREGAAAQGADWDAWEPEEAGRGARPLSSLAGALRLGEVPRGMLAAVAVLACAALVLGAVLAGRLADRPEVLLRGDSTQAAAPAAEAAPQEEGGGSEEGAGEPASIVVHVAGAVAAPGVYSLPEGSRAVDAVAAAGGLSPEADPDAVNLAAPLSDGAQLHVPAAGEGSDASAAATSSSSGLVNINTAGADELQRLPGVGPATAEAIVRERQEGGPFASPEDLLRVSGIGEGKLARIVGLVAV